MSNGMPAMRSVLGQIDWWWASLFRPRLEGLTDEEFLWAPVKRCWTVHPQPAGGTVVDYHWPPPRPTPFTTLAWRLSHIGLMLAGRTTRYFPEHAPGTWDYPPHTYHTDFPATAVGAIGFVEKWWAGWRAGLEAAGEAALWEPYGGVEGSFPEMQLGDEDPFIGMVLHTHRELIHHGAEICLLRDLYFGQQPRDPYVDALLDADVAELERLERDQPALVARYRTQRPDLPLRAAETGSAASLHLVAARGFDLNALVDGHTVLHHLAAHGDLDLVRIAVGLGADRSVKDHSGFDAAGWADRFLQTEIAAYLRAPPPN